MHDANRMPFGYLVDKNAIYYPHKEFLIDERRRCTFARFKERTDRLAASLLRKGLRPGQRAAVVQHNSIELVELYFGIIKAGGVAVPVNARLSSPEISTILADAAPSFLFVGKNYKDKVDQGAPPGLEGRVYVIGAPSGPIPDYETLMADGNGPLPEPEAGDGDTALLIYTSGTTGQPKGVMLTHRNLLCVAWATAHSRVLEVDETALVTAPLYQSGALGSMLGNILKGNTIVILDGFDPLKVMETIERERVTTALFVPTMIIKLLRSPEIERYDLSSMKSVVYGAAPMPVPVLKEALERFGWQFMGACGATETGPAYIAFLDKSDHILDGSPEREKRLGSIGREGINARVAIFDEEDRPLPPGQVGEIVVRGPHVMKGYWGKPEETARALRGGWYHTEDLGYIDGAGYIYIVDRKKDMIISGGFNIYPREIEDALIQHPAVMDTAVIGRPHQLWGETPQAFVVLEPDRPAPGPEELMDFLRARLAGYKLPKGGFVFLDELPRNSSGKVLKRVLRERGDEAT